MAAYAHSTPRLDVVIGSVVVGALALIPPCKSGVEIDAPDVRHLIRDAVTWRDRHLESGFACKMNPSEMAYARCKRDERAAEDAMATLLFALEATLD